MTKLNFLFYRLIASILLVGGLVTTVYASTPIWLYQTQPSAVSDLLMEWRDNPERLADAPSDFHWLAVLDGQSTAVAQLLDLAITDPEQFVPHLKAIADLSDQDRGELLDEAARSGDLRLGIESSFAHLGASRDEIDRVIWAGFEALMPRLLRNYQGMRSFDNPDVFDASVTREDYAALLAILVENHGVYASHLAYLSETREAFTYPRVTEAEYYALAALIVEHPDFDGEIDRRFFPAFNQFISESALEISVVAADFMQQWAELEQLAATAGIFADLHDAREYAAEQAERAEQEAERAEQEAERAEQEAERAETVRLAVEAAEAVLDLLEEQE